MSALYWAFVISLPVLFLILFLIGAWTSWFMNQHSPHDWLTGQQVSRATHSLHGIAVSVPITLGVAFVFWIASGFHQWIAIGVVIGFVIGLLVWKLATLYGPGGFGRSRTHAWFWYRGGYAGPATERDVHEHHHGRHSWGKRVAAERRAIQLVLSVAVGVAVVILFSSCDALPEARWEAMIGLGFGYLPTLLFAEL